MALIRQEIGDVLRDFRQQKGQTLRQVAARANMALGYLSEVERGQKEASSEVLASLAEALEVPVSAILREVSDRLAMLEGIPDALPVGFGNKSFGEVELDKFDAFLVANQGIRTK
jgi:transcriptional regulator with XRE-family HTH domain